MKILVTGTAGFIGYHLATALLDRGDTVVGLDSVNDYYDVNLKYNRLQNHGIDRSQIEWNKVVRSSKYEGYSFIKMKLQDKENMDLLFKREKFDAVCHLAAQAGVRYSLKNPHAYIDSNIVGFLNVLEGCRHTHVKHLAYASSSSVYGLNETMPFSTSNNVDHPVSLYAASKKSNELMAHSYSHLYGLPSTGLRFFTVYGPWGRPDMALFLFTKAMLEGKPISIFNNGEMTRDFTYVDDIVKGVVSVIDKPPTTRSDWNGKRPDPSFSMAPYKLYNIGNNSPVKLMNFVSSIEEALQITAHKEFLPMQAGDVKNTYADVDDLVKDFNYRPNTDLDVGIKSFTDWYLEYYKIASTVQ